MKIRAMLALLGAALVLVGCSQGEVSEGAARDFGKTPDEKSAGTTPAPTADPNAPAPQPDR